VALPFAVDIEDIHFFDTQRGPAIRDLPGSALVCAGTPPDGQRRTRRIIMTLCQAADVAASGDEAPPSVR
jgi:hypothetical protein